MNERTYIFNENQLKKAGFGEAFTTDLKAQMEQGVPVIEHKFQTKLQSDKVEATLYLKKSSISDYYSLKKFDLQLPNEGPGGTSKHTFFITDTNFGTSKLNQHHFENENRVTLMEAYNLMAGRSVYKLLADNKGNPAHAWMQFRPNKKEGNVNEAEKILETKLGFDLEKVLNNYSIKELKENRSRQSLIQSLHRGNIKKVTFVGPKKEETRLYISPNINTGTLDVRDKHGQRLSTGELTEKKFLGKTQALVANIKHALMPSVDLNGANTNQRLRNDLTQRFNDYAQRSVSKHKIR